MVHRCSKSVTVEPQRDDVIVIASRTLVKAVDLYLGCRIDRIGNQFVEQTSGLPIGGYLSSALLDVHMSSAENIFDCKTWKTTSPPNIKHLPRNKVVATFRYEDDILCISHLLCPDCVDKLVETAYGQRIQVDRCNDEMLCDGQHIKQKFLDMI
eukprot:6510915-Karenia_brevis.AAC.1